MILTKTTIVLFMQNKISNSKMYKADNDREREKKIIRGVRI